jgi:hypothetical protein
MGPTNTKWTHQVYWLPSVKIGSLHLFPGTESDIICYARTYACCWANLIEDTLVCNHT